jgi:hypothetical protein
MGIIVTCCILMSCRTENVVEPYTDVSEFAYINSVMRIISPEFGDKWNRGTTQTIRWFMTDDVKSVNIHLFRKNEFKFTIEKGVTGYKYDWKIPIDLAKSHHYRIRVSNSANSEQYVVSKDFHILQ